MTTAGETERQRFLTDEGFNLSIVAGLKRIQPRMDILTLQATDLLHAADPVVLTYAKESDPILLSHDVRTMPDHFAAFLMDLSSGEWSPGLILVPWETPIGMAIQWILEIWEASRHEEWRNLPIRLPL